MKRLFKKVLFVIGKSAMSLAERNSNALTNATIAAEPSSNASSRMMNNIHAENNPNRTISKNIDIAFVTQGSITAQVPLIDWIDS